MMKLYETLDGGRMRNDYRDEARERAIRSARLAAVVGAGLLLLFIPIDLLQAPDVFYRFLGFRIGAAGTLGAVYLLLRLPIGARMPYFFMLLIALVATAVVFAMMLGTGWLASTHYSGLNMLMLTLSLLVTWGPVWSAMHSSLVVATFVFITFFLGAADDPRFIPNVVALIASGVLACAASSIRQRLQWSEFERRWSVAEAYRHKSEFFANVSHELRTPIHVMVGYVDMLLDGDATWGDGEETTMLQRIRAEGLNLHKLVSDLLDSAKVEAGKMEVQWQRLAVEDIAHGLLESFRPLIEEKGLRVAFRCAADLPEIDSDEGKIRQVLTNLLANALKFTARGQIRLEVTATADITDEEWGSFFFLDDALLPGTPSRSEARDGVAVLVSDTGIGIRRGELKTLAQDYTQAQSNDTGQYGGTGLGLSLSRKLTALLGGRLAVRSSEGIGSTFAVFLPGKGVQVAAETSREPADCTVRQLQAPSRDLVQSASAS